MPFASCVSLARFSWCAFFLWTLAAGATLSSCGVEPRSQQRPLGPRGASVPPVPDEVPVAPQPTAPVPEPPPVEHDSEPEPEPCVDVVCALHSSCVPSVGVCVCDDGFSKTPDGTCVKVNEDYGFIGAACTTASDCRFAGGKCLLEDDGYSRGHCTQSCASVCPDRDSAPITFCSDAGRPSAAPTCFAQCDYQQYPNTNGCRPDYSCVSASRAGDAEVFRAVCVPTNWGLSESCDDPSNFAQNNTCYLQQASFGDAEAEALLEALLQGVATAQQAERFLDLNYSGSQTFIRDEITTTFNNNYTPGHSSSRPMRGMIVHYTASQREDGTIRYFLGADPHGSSHFIVGSYRNGLIVQLFSHRHRTWHAGGNYNPDYFGFDFANAGYLRRSNGTWRDYAKREYVLRLPVFGREPVRVTGGIPDGEQKYAVDEYWQPYTYHQLLSFVAVTRALHLVYGLSPQTIRRHGDVTASRVDPGPQSPTTALVDLVFSMQDVFSEAWLDAYKVDPEWIINHPGAR